MQPCYRLYGQRLQATACLRLEAQALLGSEESQLFCKQKETETKQKESVLERAEVQQYLKLYRLILGSKTNTYAGSSVIL